MTTDPIDYRAEAVALFARAKAALGETDEPYDVPADYAVVGILAALLALDDDALNREEQHQSEKFEATYLTPRRELDEDNPDTLVGDAGLAGDDADTISRPVSFGGILDTPRVDSYGSPGPWSAA